MLNVNIEPNQIRTVWNHNNKRHHQQSNQIRTVDIVWTSQQTLVHQQSNQIRTVVLRKYHIVWTSQQQTLAHQQSNQIRTVVLRKYHIVWTSQQQTLAHQQSNQIRTVVLKLHCLDITTTNVSASTIKSNTNCCVKYELKYQTSQQQTLAHQQSNQIRTVVLRKYHIVWTSQQQTLSYQQSNQRYRINNQIKYELLC
ncbi:unnamed protein product [Mytilus coruscus]|uniref:Uncharacterized protein n=1 Tax=Mytilus coruscus TaxID=42192 RepID=A0A6J8APH0_MYTCO|nr:unnamed protein product [Mytilus coruscus]